MHGRISGGGGEVASAIGTAIGIRQRVAERPCASAGKERGKAGGRQLSRGNNAACARGSALGTKRGAAGAISSLGWQHLTSGT